MIIQKPHCSSDVILNNDAFVIEPLFIAATVCARGNEVVPCHDALCFNFIVTHLFLYFRLHVLQKENDIFFNKIKLNKI